MFGDHHFVRFGDGHALRRSELAVAFTPGAPLAHKRAVRAEHLHTMVAAIRHHYFVVGTHRDASRAIELTRGVSEATPPMARRKIVC